MVSDSNSSQHHIIVLKQESLQMSIYTVSLLQDGLKFNEIAIGNCIAIKPPPSRPFIIIASGIILVLHLISILKRFFLINVTHLNVEKYKNKKAMLCSFLAWIPHHVRNHNYLFFPFLMIYFHGPLFLKKKKKTHGPLNCVK